ncbi:MAG: hypothetical protein V9G20_25350 [Candidatus Promineifilaceae bacterium]
MIERIEGCFAAANLTITRKATLATYPGCTHWHLKLGQQPGTLEATYWPQENRFWFKVARNRSAPWIETVLPSLQTCMASITTLSVTL